MEWNESELVIEWKESELVMKGPFCTARKPFCKKAKSVLVPVGKTLVVRYEDLNNDAIETLDIVGDGVCVNVKDFVLANGGFDDLSDFKINGGNVIYSAM